MSKTNPDSGIYLWGAALGLIAGVLSAHFFQRARLENEAQTNNPSQIAPGDLLKIALLVIGVMRQIAEFGAGIAKESEQ